jgi:Gas vesicle synthesis protein GvpL/GvpF
MIHVYAFAQGLGALPPVDGLDGAPLEGLAVDGVTAVFSRRTRSTSAEALRADALTHAAVVDAVTAAATACLPARFSEPSADEDALARLVRERGPALRGRFGLVAGCVEVAVRVLAAAPAAARPQDGVAYLRHRRELERRREETAGRLHRLLCSIARETRLTVAAGAREQLTAAYLVPRDRLDEVRSVVDGFGIEHPELTVVCTGPWPPYSFAGEAA